MYDIFDQDQYHTAGMWSDCNANWIDVVDKELFQLQQNHIYGPLNNTSGVDQLRCSGELYTVIYTYEGNHGIHRSSWTWILDQLE